MAACIHPRWVKVVDAFSGATRMVQIGCGKCANCIANQQDEWATRIRESCVHAEHFIYTTLTFSPEAFEKHNMLLDVSDAILSGESQLSQESLGLLSYYSDKHFFGALPLFEKKVLSDWIKRGREKYFSDYHKRLSFKYLFTMELGPVHSRPHAHGIIIGLSKDVYRKYFADPWKADFGFYNLQYIRRNPKFFRSCVGVSRYISKYINKGFFESPLVKDGLLPKCWRMVSNGIGEELLTHEKYALFQTDYYKSMVERCQRVDISLKPKFEATAELYRGRKVSFWTSDPCKYISRVVSDPLSFLGLSNSLIKRLCLYVDDDSFSHRLPRYYRERILGRMPNLFKFAVQIALQQDACKRYNTKLLQIAANLERTRPYSFGPPDDARLLHSWALSMAGYVLATTEKNEAIRSEQRHFIEMKNHYLRPKRFKGRNVFLNQ